ncbi:DUF1338 domain-containing protein [Motiliproteus sp. MSK22-1]|uniref:DUF1338 domain-containing protein n=1 Tax=Motiliproteus sp. MSK22-1 TaxID=1897630 RepID=UPI0009787793|nr:DUF1338 domain-containing protein [Motiliproteus sp. MSK22-1]OMH33286.1 succinyldiaminopimelate aminotransferase [Motiliproteus sp. MSK22-1]
MNITQFYSSLWKNYVEITPQAGKIHEIFSTRGETVINDHVAFRTFSDSPISLDNLEPALRELGYSAFDSYIFKSKNLIAKSYNHSDKDAPKIFLSELQRHHLSDSSQKILSRLVSDIPANCLNGCSIFFDDLLWSPISIEDYDTLLSESEYAAWTATMGLRANHFTVSVNHLKQFNEVSDINQLLKDCGFAINTSGGEVKGTPEIYLEQSSTLADKITVEFADGTERVIPSCFYEFAKRYPMSDGELFQGFVADNADRIFESTNAAA